MVWCVPVGNSEQPRRMGGAHNMNEAGATHHRPAMGSGALGRLHPSYALPQKETAIQIFQCPTDAAPFSPVSS